MTIHMAGIDGLLFTRTRKRQLPISKVTLDRMSNKSCEHAHKFHIIMYSSIYRAHRERAGFIPRRLPTVKFYPTCESHYPTRPNGSVLPTGQPTMQYHLAKKPKKLLLLPTFCAFSALRSIALFPFGKVGIGGPLKCGLGGLVDG